MAFEFTLSDNRVVIDGTTKQIGTISEYTEGSTEFALTGTDAANFEIVGGTLKIKSTTAAGKYSIVINGTSPMDTGTLNVNIYAFPSGSILITPVEVTFDSSMPRATTGVQAAAWSSNGLLLYTDNTGNGNWEPPTPDAWVLGWGSIADDGDFNNLTTHTTGLTLQTITSVNDDDGNPHTLATGDVVHVIGIYMMSTIIINQAITIPALANPATQLSTPTATAAATSDSITLTFESVANASSYKLRYGTSNPPTGDGSAYMSGTALTGLTANTTYYLQTKSIGDGTNCSDSDWSAVITQSTSAANTAPTAIALAGATSNAKLQRRVLGQTEVYDLGALTVTDPDVGDTSTLAITAQIISGDDSPTPENLNYFALSGNNITAISTTPPGIYLVTVTATDSHGATCSQQFTITIASALIDPNDFVVTTLSATSVQAAFTIPTNTSNTAQIKWQRSTVDPDSANFNDANWVTIKTTDITGETVL